MKRLTLNEAWRLCMNQHRWIKKQRAKYKGKKVKMPRGICWRVNAFKREWMKRHGPRNVDHNCVFCEYALQQRDKAKSRTFQDKCTYCPGVLIDTDFSCTENLYHFARRHDRFLDKLQSLNRKRKK